MPDKEVKKPTRGPCVPWKVQVNWRIDKDLDERLKADVKALKESRERQYRSTAALANYIIRNWYSGPPCKGQ